MDEDRFQCRLACYGGSKMGLCGFLAPDGTFTECESWAHMDTAKSIAKSKHNTEFDRGYDAEKFLYEKGYVGFYARNTGHTWISKQDKRIILLSDEQRDFIIKNLSSANNDDQRKSMEELLEWDEGYREDSILHHYENKIVT